MFQFLTKLLADQGAESKQVLRLIHKVRPQSHQPSVKFLEVGCGFAGPRSLLRNKNYNVLGIEANLAIVDSNVKEGLNCISVDQFKTLNDKFDVILMSHIIEHFSPADLLLFMDHYLDYLKPNGFLVICTPLMTSNFYDDFDHIKPYHPVGIQMVFGGSKSQVQYYSRNKLVLRDIWFRRSPLKNNLSRSLYVKTLKSRGFLILDLLFCVLFLISGGLIGRKTGWVGVFEKSVGS